MSKRDSEVPTERDNAIPEPPIDPTDPETFAIIVKNMLDPLEKKIDRVIAAYEEERELRKKTEELLKLVSRKNDDLTRRVEILEEAAE